MKKSAAVCLVLVGVLPSACIEQGINRQPIREIAVVTGDFDNMAENLDRLEVGYQIYEGFICCASYDSSIDPSGTALKAETLFSGALDSGAREILNYDAVFLNSGSRGWGSYEYNSIEEDDTFLKDETALANIEEFVSRGGLLVASDWTYDVVAAIWPDMVQFKDGGDERPDAAQAGVLGSVQADVVDSSLEEMLGQESVTLEFNYSNWTIIESVGSEAEVFLSGDVKYRVSASDGYDNLSDVPLLLRFEHGQGQVVFSAFHWNAQTADLADKLLLEVAEGLQVGGGSDEE
jgi:hypothetical protein